MSNLASTTVVNPPNQSPERTIVVTGIPRSGTSMLVGLVEQLGIPVSAVHPSQPVETEYAVHEDERINRVLLYHDLEGFGRLARENDARWPVWGFKHLYGLEHLHCARMALRNPHYLVTTRDLAAVMQREYPPRAAEPWQVVFRDMIDRFGKVVAFIRLTDAPLCLISYERALRRPEEAVAAIADFCGWQSSEEQLSQAARSIQRPTDSP